MCKMNGRDVINSITYGRGEDEQMVAARVRTAQTVMMIIMMMMMMMMVKREKEKKKTARCNAIVLLFVRL